MKMKMKKLSAIVLALLLSVIPMIPVSAENDLARLLDAADLLTDSEEEALMEKLDEISERQQVDIVIVTVDSLEGETAMDYADDFYDYNEYGLGDGDDGILFLVSMEERESYISTHGYGITAVTDAGREHMFDVFIDDMSDGNYMEAFTTFAELCDDYITQARTGEPYDVGNLPKEPFSAGMNLLISLVIAFVIALIVTGVMRSKLKTVSSQSGADSYVKKDSMKLKKKNDLFLYRNVNRRKKPKNESSSSSGGGGSKTHTSSSGRTHGGGGRKF